MKKYIHIGYPKNFSTSLQRDYFSKHPDLFHLGVGIGGNLGYYDSEVEKAFEVYLKSCKKLKYYEKEKHFQRHFKKLFNCQSEKPVGVSSEHISFSFTHDSLDIVEKVRRLHSIFGDNTTIIMIVRNQFDLIKSLYRESVRVGLPVDFGTYVKLLYKYQDRNFLYDLRYDLVYEVLSEYFGSSNIHMLFYENYKEGQDLVAGEKGPLIVEDIDDILGIGHKVESLDHYNEALSRESLSKLYSLNQAHRHGLGNHLLESAEKHRIRTYLEQDLNFNEPEEVTYSDVIQKRENIEKAGTGDVAIEYSVDKDVSDWLGKFYGAGNRLLEEPFDLHPPDSYWNMKW